MPDPRLPFSAPVDALAITASYEHRQGWTVFIRARRSGEGWADGHRGRYEFLEPAELLDVIDADIVTLLNL